MTALKTIVLAAAATAALASPTFAQNFQGFGVPSWVADGYRAQESRPVALKARKIVKHYRHDQAR